MFSQVMLQISDINDGTSVTSFKSSGKFRNCERYCMRVAYIWNQMNYFSIVF